MLRETEGRGLVNSGRRDMWVVAQIDKLNERLNSLNAVLLESSIEEGKWIKRIEELEKHIEVLEDQPEMSLTNLGDVTGCTVVVNFSKPFSVDQVTRLLDKLKAELPEVAHFLFLCDGVDVSLEGEPEGTITGQGEA